jgi:hydrogenase expression/formation protein HypC
MCLAVPGQVLQFDDSNPELKMAKVSFGGINKDICVQFVPEVKIGDYVLVHVGFALSVLDEEDAKETFRILNEMGAIDE